MPIYEYQCRQCCRCFETLVLSEREAAPVCPSCRSGEVEKLMSAGCVRAQGIPSGAGGFKPSPCRTSSGG